MTEQSKKKKKRQNQSIKLLPLHVYNHENVRSVLLPDLPPERSSKVLVVAEDIETTRLRAKEGGVSPGLLEGVLLDSRGVHLLLLWY